MTIEQIAIAMKINRTTLIRWLTKYTSSNSINSNYKGRTKRTDDKLILELANKNENFNLDSLKTAFKFKKKAGIELTFLNYYLEMFKKQ